jgi:hypothetical protein
MLISTPLKKFLKNFKKSYKQKKFDGVPQMLVFHCAAEWSV